MKKLSIGAVVTAMALSSTSPALGKDYAVAGDYEGHRPGATTPYWDENGGNIVKSIESNGDAINHNGEVLDQVSGDLAILKDKFSTTEKTAENAATVAGQANDTANSAKLTAEGAATKVDGFENRINNNRENITQNTNKINDHETRITNNTIAISTFDNRITQNANDIQVNRENIWENKQSIIKETNERILGDKQTLQESKAYTDSKYGELSAMIEKNKKDTFAGVAAALAASQVPQVTQGSAFSLGAGAGTYQGQTAVAIGMSARFADDVITKLTVTADTQQRIGVGAGYAVEW